MPNGQEFSRVEEHYRNGGLEAAILAALAAAGKDLDSLKPEDLAPLDEFHIRGRKATLELARELNLRKESKVLDVGCGIGGPSRTLALEYGCHVTGIDLTPEYCRAAEMLSRRLALDGQVMYLHGNAVKMPFENCVFDVVWTQHASMNIADKRALYAEMWRVLKPGGKLAFYDVFQGTGGAPHYPVPWAHDPADSFLVSPDQTRSILEDTGFEVVVWRDVTETGRSWFRHLGEKIRKDGPPPLGIHLLLGPDFSRMARNQVLNLEESRISLIETVAHRPL